jgi:hypothetical protein
MYYQDEKNYVSPFKINLQRYDSKVVTRRFNDIDSKLNQNVVQHDQQI